MTFAASQREPQAGGLEAQARGTGTGEGETRVHSRRAVSVQRRQ